MIDKRVDPRRVAATRARVIYDNEIAVALAISEQAVRKRRKGGHLPPRLWRGGPSSRELVELALSGRPWKGQAA